MPGIEEVLRVQLDSLTKENQALKTRLQGLPQIEEIKKQMEGLTRENQDLKTRMPQFDELKGQLDGLTRENQDLKARLQALPQIEPLKTELARLQGENQDLQQRLQIITRPPRSPDDFASAMRNSLDSLQGRLAAMANPMSDFALKEFHIETNVHIEVTTLGSVNYRFVQPQDKIEPEKLTRLSMTLVPIPKQSAAGSYNPAYFSPETDLAQVPGLDEGERKILAANQIYSVGDLLSAGSRVRSTAELAAVLAVDRQKLGQWLGSAELLTIRGMDGPKARVLADAGIGTLAQLAALAPEEVLKRYNEKAAAEGQKPIEAAQAETWVKAARAFAGR